MADSIKIKGGTGNVPKLADRELGYSKDAQALFIGTEKGNVMIGGVFFAIHGETSYNNIKAALNAGKVVACKLESGTILWLVKDFEGSYTFSATDGMQVITVGVTAEGWSAVHSEIFATQEYIDNLFADINARLDALAPSE